MSPGRLNDTAIDQLRAGLSGAVIRPGDPDYEQARTIFNAMIDRRPAVLAQCETVEDVVAAVRFGREHDLEIAVRGGGHGVAGKALTDSGIVVDLRRMTTVEVDPDARTARVGGGATMGDLDPGHPGPSPGHHRRPGIDHRDRRVRTRRRQRMA
ncbi:MAG: FAD-dependent oxidoreductase, partial [Sporichthyaceae bacterium]|nr:FAD-dependent oxidoreductase [Sporichthyaceae bacterium]